MEGGGGGARAGSGRRITLLDQMSAIADGGDLSGLTLDDILRSRKRAVPEPPPPPPFPSEPPIQPGRTLLDIIRDEDPKASSCKEFVGNRDRKSWKSFKDRLRLKRTGSGAAWTSSVHIPTSDILSPSTRSQVSRRSSARNSTESAHEMIPLEDASSQGFRPHISLSRRSSCRFSPNALFASDPALSDDGSNNNNNNNSGAPPAQVPTLRPQISRRHSTRFSPVIEDSVTDPTEPPPPMREGSRRLYAVLAEERSLSAREAVAAQEAAEEAAAAAAAAADEAVSTAEAAATPVAETGPQPVRMSLMDLLEETDRQMGFVGSRYMIGDEDDEDYEEEEEEEEDGGGGGGGGVGGVEQNCCVCMVRHKGAAFIPCGHTFCRLCSRELWVSRGNCPLCNGFILEILDIF
ncbi:hypothetical protein L484_003042 [Morus notabilis]|uniref:RING-type domain-containing protein n=1 Tax=Morus notabilis TaxID=981085 RepID=W9SC41_9ROSA|nr:uncharacterized protein LOC21386588 [Morus notabilis]EXC25118.1 hypothetical protein L484_003042 [Morus notabilis]